MVADDFMRSYNPKACHDGSWIEDKNVQLTFHYRQVPEKIRPVMVEKAEKIIAGNGFKVKVVKLQMQET